MDKISYLSANEIQLIRLIRQRPELFYKTAIRYRTKEKLWKEVADKLNCTGKRCFYMHLLFGLSILYIFAQF